MSLMESSLFQRLKNATATLRKVEAALGRNPNALPDDVETHFRSFLNVRSDIDHWVTMIDARTAAWKLLDGLEMGADTNDLVPFGNTRAKFVHVRLIGVQAYVATNWALADSMMGAVGRVLCTRDAGSNDASPAQLVSHFVLKDRKKILLVHFSRRCDVPLGGRWAFPTPSETISYTMAASCRDQIFLRLRRPPPRSEFQMKAGRASRKQPK
jgi:hypothetical protein